jgi:hypothetical protein
MFPTLNRFNWWGNIWISEEVTRRTLSRTYSPKFHSQDCLPVIEREIFAWRRNPFDAKLIDDTFSSNSLKSLQTLLWDGGTKNLLPEFFIPCGTSYLSKTFSGQQPRQVVHIKSTFQTLNASTSSRFSENCLGWQRCQVVQVNRRFGDRTVSIIQFLTSESWRWRHSRSTVLFNSAAVKASKYTLTHFRKR